MNEQNVLATELDETLKEIKKDEDIKIDELKHLLNMCELHKAGMGKVSEMMGQIKENVSQMRELHEAMPIEIDNIVWTLAEMKNGSGPDVNADYRD